MRIMKDRSVIRYSIQCLVLSVILVISTGCGRAFAQFEGSFDIYQRMFGDAGTPVKEGKVSILVAENRIRINGLDGAQLPEQLGGMKTNSILIRLDKKDFIVFGEKSVAVQIEKSEIVNMLNLVSSVKNHLPGTDTTSSKANVVTTNQKKTIYGYPCQKVVIHKFENGKEVTANVWITKKIPVYWGMLTESWGSDDSDIADMLSPLWLKNGTLPIFAQIFQDGVKRMTIRIEHIQKRKIPHSKMDLPPDVHLISFREMLLQKMFGG